MSGFALTLLLCAALAIIVFFIMPGQQRIELFSENSERASWYQRMQKALKAAGLFDQTPSLVLLSLIVVSAVVALIFYLTTGVLVSAIFAPILVAISAQVYLYRRQRQFMGRAINELIPFLNRIATSAKGGRPVQQAYLDAVAESKVLKEVLGESAAKIAAGAPFSPTLVETLPNLPLRMWAAFVRQVELYEQTGGDFSTGIDRTVTQVNQMLQLQAETRAETAAQARQQQFMVVILLAGLFLYMTLVEGGSERIGLLFDNLFGIIGGLTGLTVIAFGIWFLNKQIRDVEKKLSF